MRIKRRLRLIVAAVIVVIALVALWFLILRRSDSGANLPEQISSEAKPSAREATSEKQLQSTSSAPDRPAGSAPAQSAEKRSHDTPLFVIVGRVLSDEGEGLAGARLEVFNGRSSQDRDAPVRVLTAEKAGAYHLELEFAEYQVIAIRAEMPGFSSAEEAVRMHSEGEVSLDFVLSRSNSALSGRVVDYEGKGVAGAQVRIHVPHRGREGLASAGVIVTERREAAYSSTNGNFFFGGLSPGPAGLLIVAEGYLPSEGSVELEPGKNTVEIRLKRTEKLEVRVSNRAGEPVPNANISSLWLDSLVQAQTRPDGVALLPIPADVIDQEIELGVKAKGYLYRVVKRRPGLTRVEVVLLEASQLVGRVTTERGEPLQGCTVMTRARVTDPDGRRSAFPGGGMGRTDQDGRFSVEAVEPGRLYVSCKDFPGLVRPVSAEDAGRELTIVLKSQDSAILGQVIDSSDRPVTDFWISLEQGGAGDPIPASQSEGSSLQRAFHNSQGRFSFPAINAGVWTVTAWSEDGSLAGRLRIELPPGQATDGVVVRVKPMK